MVELAYTPEPNTFSSKPVHFLQSFQVRLLSRPGFRSQPTRMSLQAAVRVRAWPLAGGGESVARLLPWRGPVEAKAPPARATQEIFNGCCPSPFFVCPADSG